MEIEANPGRLEQAARESQTSGLHGKKSLDVPEGRSENGGQDQGEESRES